MSGTQLLKRGAIAVLLFFHRRASAVPLAVLRIAMSAVLLVQAASIAGHAYDLFGERGVVQWTVLQPAEGGGLFATAVPHVRWLATIVAPWGISPAACVQIVFACYMTSLVGLLAGWRTRTMAAVAWFTHLSLTTSGYASIYGVDTFANCALFYLIWMPAGRSLSVDALQRPEITRPSSLARISLRVLQLHMCLVYLTSGIEKASGPQWWNGEAIWRSLLLPELRQFDFTWLSAMPWLAMLLGLSTLAVEIGYPLFVWSTRTRWAMVAATIGLHLGIALFLGLTSFAAVMIVLNIAAFLVPSEPGVWARLWMRLLQSHRSVPRSCCHRGTV